MILNAINVKTVGESLRKARESKGMTKQELARAIKKRERYITNIEKGLNSNFNLEEICNILGVEVDSLCKTDPDTSDVVNRILLSCVYQNISLSKIFEKLGLSHGNVHFYKTHPERFSSDLVKQIANELGIPYKWIWTGQGDTPLIPNSISEIGNYIRMERLRQKLSQIQLANRCGWQSAANVINVESHPEKCQNKTILRIIKELKINPEIFSKINFGERDKSRPYIDKQRLTTYNTQRRQEVFGQRAREARQIKNMTQTEVAEKVGCSPSTISAIENNKHDDSIVSTKTLANVLGVTEDWLWGGDSKPPLTNDDVTNSSITPITTPTKLEKLIDGAMNLDYNDTQLNSSTDSLCNLIMVKLKGLNESNLIKVYDRIIELEKLDKYERMKNNERNLDNQK